MRTVIAEFLSNAGISAAAADAGAAMAPEDLTLLAADMTVLVNCWKLTDGAASLAVYRFRCRSPPAASRLPETHREDRVDDHQLQTAEQHCHDQDPFRGIAERSEIARRPDDRAEAGADVGNCRRGPRKANVTKSSPVAESSTATTPSVTMKITEKRPSPRKSRPRRFARPS